MIKLSKRRLLSLIVMLIFISIGAKLHAQIAVEGFVKDKNNEPLIGVSVLEEGTKNMTITDINGNYSIKVTDAQSSLQYTYVGFEKKNEKVGARKVINVILQENIQLLDEVMVVGYGVQRKHSVTAAISQVKADEALSKAPVANISNRIAGVVPGVISLETSGQPGSTSAATMTIRGKAAKYIVDGVQRSFDQLDPNEIETITVLKDASAAAIYGLNASSVVIITTKRGLDKPSEISFSIDYGISQNANMLKLLNGPEYAYWYNKARELDGDDIIFYENQVQKMRAGIDGWGNTNWYKKTFGTGHNTQMNLSARGGTDRIKYFTSIGSLNQDGNIDGFDYNRINIRSNIDATIAKNLTFSLDLSGRVEKTNTPGFSADATVANTVPFQAIRALPYLPTEYDGLTTSAASSHFNPIAASTLSGYNKTRVYALGATMSMEYKAPFLEGLSVKGVVAYGYNHNMSKALATPYIQSIARLPDKMAEDLEYTKGYDLRGGGDYLGEGSSLYRDITSYLQLNYNNQFGDHTVGATAVGEIFRSNSNNISASGEGLDFYELDELNQLRKIDKRMIGGASSVSKRVGFVGRLNYGYKSKYLAEVSARYDGYDRFSGMHSNQWGLFPALSLAWRISEENFIKDNTSIVDDLKLRVGIGKTGNASSVSDYTYLTSLIAHSAPAVILGGKENYGYYTGSIPNYDLSWEKHMQYNVGLDVVLWRGLLRAEIDVYYKYIYDIIDAMGGEEPSSVGGYFPGLGNINKQDFRGFEVSLTHENKVGDLKYSVNLTGSYTKGRWLRYSGDSPNTPDWKKVTGQRIGAMQGFIADGLFQSQEEIDNSPVLRAAEGNLRLGDIRYIDRNGDGIISYEQDYGFVGKSSTPEFVGGLNVRAEWKGLDFFMRWQTGLGRDVALSGQYGSGVIDNTSFTRPFYNGGNSPKYLLERSWTPENTGGEFPRLGLEIPAGNNNLWGSTFWIRNGNYLRMKELEVGYTIPKSIISKVRISNLRFYVSGQNLLTFSKLDKYNIDPEAPSVNNGYYPQQRILSFGAKLTF